jgi:hypothetical protein
MIVPLFIFFFPASKILSCLLQQYYLYAWYQGVTLGDVEDTRNFISMQ